MCVCVCVCVCANWSIFVNSPFTLVGWEGSLTKIDYRKQGTLILTSLLEDLVKVGFGSNIGAYEPDCEPTLRKRAQPQAAAAENSCDLAPECVLQCPA